MKKRFLSWFVAYMCTAVTVQAAPTVSMNYDGAGRLATRTTALGFQSTLAYDAFEQVQTITFPANQGAASFEYNGQGAPTGVSDSRSNRTLYDADGFGQTITAVSPDTGTTQNSFDDAGNLTRFTRAGGQNVSLTYDALDRLTSVNAADFSANFNYDEGNAVGRLTSLTDSAGQTIWSYDAKGRIASKTQTIDARSLSVGYSWQGDRLSRITYPSGRVVTFALDHGRVSSISVDGQFVITNVSYQALGDVAGWSMGAAGTYLRNFDGYGRVIGYTGPTGQRTLTLDDDNRITAIKEASGALLGAYGYDSVGRIVSATDAGIVRGYSYDLNGNRIQLTQGGVSYSVDVAASSNRINSVTLPGLGRGAYSYQYDDNGNTLSSGRVQLQWNSLGLPVHAATESRTTEYTYNGQGSRVRKASSEGGVRYFVYAEDNLTLLGEYDSAGQPVTEYVYLAGLPVLALKASGTFYVLADHLGTPRGIKDSRGSLVWQWDPDAFGNGAPQDEIAGVGVFESNLRFPGQVYDKETHLHYNNARYYDPATGRYLSSDQVGLEAGLNTYSYVNGHPTGLSDLSGNNPLVTIAIGAAVGGAVGAYSSRNGDMFYGFMKGAAGGVVVAATMAIGAPALGNMLGSQLLAGTASGAVAGGLGNTVVQHIDVKAGLRKEIDFDEVQNAAVLGAVSGAFLIRPGTARCQNVSAYAQKGQIPDFAPGRWVMASPKDPISYARTLAPLWRRYPYTAGRTARLPRENLQYPEGLTGNLTGLFGHRIVK